VQKLEVYDWPPVKSEIEMTINLITISSGFPGIRHRPVRRSHPGFLRNENLCKQSVMKNKANLISATKKAMVFYHRR
jgi:hypothetical protein